MLLSKNLTRIMMNLHIFIWSAVLLRIVYQFINDLVLLFAIINNAIYFRLHFSDYVFHFIFLITRKIRLFTPAFHFHSFCFIFDFPNLRFFWLFLLTQFFIIDLSLIIFVHELISYLWLRKYFSPPIDRATLLRIEIRVVQH